MVSFEYEIFMSLKKSYLYGGIRVFVFKPHEYWGQVLFSKVFLGSIHSVAYSALAKPHFHACNQQIYRTGKFQYLDLEKKKTMNNFKNVNLSM